uniref:Uncharacterized protein n=1 Tax=Sphaerodactylus townsendi TaxID=933632 RepID=A0ACB8F997_9SAUR
MGLEYPAPTSALLGSVSNRILLRSAPSGCHTPRQAGRERKLEPPVIELGMAGTPRCVLGCTRRWIPGYSQSSQREGTLARSPPAAAKPRSKALRSACARTQRLQESSGRPRSSNGPINVTRVARPGRVRRPTNGRTPELRRRRPPPADERPDGRVRDRIKLNHAKQPEEECLLAPHST